MKMQNNHKLIIKKLVLHFTALGLATSLFGCASTPANQTFAPATEVITKMVTVPMQTPLNIDASFGFGSNPALVAAYQAYQKTGKAPHVTTAGFEGFPYDPAQQIYIACKPLHICTILLQQDEQIKNLSIGDSANWDVAPMIVGSNWPNAAIMLAIKPKAEDLATDLIITTDKSRIYNISLTTSDSSYIRQAIFYYPTDTSLAIANAQQGAVSQTDQQSQSVVTTLNNGTNINLNNVNFNYSLSGDSPTWKPMRVFDDGTHTIIQFPASVNSGVLPVLFVLNNGQDELVNFRKKTEANGTVDYVVDQVFAQAVLVSGVGNNQTKVVITNKKLDQSWF